MAAIVGAILVLSGSVLFAGGMIAQAVKSNQGGEGYFFGGIVGLLGLIIMCAGWIRRAWDAVPTGGDRRPPTD